MPIRLYKPTSNGRRDASVNMHTEVTKTRPEKSLCEPLTKNGGRNHHGKITVQGRGGGHKRNYRKIDFKRRDRIGIPAKVIGIEYDPNRTCHIALLEYEDGVRRYILAPAGLTDGNTVIATDEAVDPKPGVSMLIKHIPTGLNIHNIELTPGKGGQMCRSAGTYARLTNKEGKYATIVLPSGEIRQISIECRVTIGAVGNPDHQQRKLGKAGKSRHLGRRPQTRGIARNHNDHPLGGGDGKSKKNRAPMSESGVLSKGGSTRNRSQHSEKLIIRRRKTKRYGQLR